MVSVIRSMRLKGVSGLIALALVGSGVGAVYATTAAPDAASSAASVSTGTSTGTGTGTTPPTPGPKRDRNGIVVDLAPAGKQVQGFSRQGSRIFGTIVPTKATYKKIRNQFMVRPGKVKKVNRTVYVVVKKKGKDTAKKVGTFKVNKYGHLRFSTNSVPKTGKKVQFVLVFTSKFKVRGKFRDRNLGVAATTPFRR